MRILITATIFLSAFLLFLIQPLIAKQITPWFGGTSAVWSTCMMFFQVTLVIGYAYSDFVVRRLRPKTQSLLHIVFLLAALLALPIIPSIAWKPTGQTDPSLRVFALLLVTVGLPYFMLSTTGPLLQAWYTRRFPGTGVYRLFALSNLASLVALISYPFIIEPYFTTRQQSWGWSIGFVLFALSCMLSAWKGRNSTETDTTSRTAPEKAEGNTETTIVIPPKPVDYAIWTALAALGSTLLLAITNHLTQNLAAVPLLWLLPLTLYLLSFILCFDGQGWYRRNRFAGPVLILLFLMAFRLYSSIWFGGLWSGISLYAAGLFACCMLLHGELANRKPSPRYLTRFYLMISLGGALGSVFVSVIAPHVFSSYFELPIAMIAMGVLVPALLRRNATTSRQFSLPLMLALFSTFCTVSLCWLHYMNVQEHTILMQRNFYGALRIISYQNRATGDVTHYLTNGNTLHGSQFIAPKKRDTLTTYYGKSSGIGYAFEKMAFRPMNVGIIGLGTGTLAAYGRVGDHFRFYEINPQVRKIAQTQFWYLHDTAAKVDIVSGDARLSLEQELKNGKPGKFDILAIDAFTSDSIPIHLLTREALQIYRQHIKPDGVIAFHTSNQYLELPPVIKQLADEAKMHVFNIIDRPHDPLFVSNWVLVTNNEHILDDHQLKSRLKHISHIPGLRPWTDNYSNLFQIIAH